MPLNTCPAFFELVTELEWLEERLLAIQQELRDKKNCSAELYMPSVEFLNLVSYWHDNVLVTATLRELVQAIAQAKDDQLIHAWNKLSRLAMRFERLFASDHGKASLKDAVLWEHTDALLRNIRALRKLGAGEIPVAAR